MDPFSSATHLIGAIAFGCLGISLVRRARGDRRKRLALVVFSLCCALMFLASGLFHLMPYGGAARYVMHRVDHAAIFIFIAATFTPIHAIAFSGLGRWGVLAAVWTIALAGLTLKLAYFDSMPQWLGLTLYLSFGWLGLASVIALSRRLGVVFIGPLAAGALAYTSGALADYSQWPAPLPPVIGSHEVFHLAVLAGVACHWWFVRRIAGGPVTPE